MKKYENEDIIVSKGRYNKEYNKKSASEEFRKSIQYKPGTPSKNNNDRFNTAISLVKPGLDRFAVGEGSYERRQKNEKEQLKEIHKRREEREKKRKRIKGVTAILLAGTLTVGAGGVAISKLHDKFVKENQAKLEQIDFTEKEKAEYGITDYLLAQKDNIGYNIDDMSDKDNQELLQMLEEIKDLRKLMFDEKIASALGISADDVAFKEASDAPEHETPAEVKVLNYDSYEKNNNKLKEKYEVSGYLENFEKVNKELEEYLAESRYSSFNRKDLEKRIEKTYNSAVDMLYKDTKTTIFGGTIETSNMSAKKIEKKREKENEENKVKTIIIDDNGKEHEINDDDAR